MAVDPFSAALAIGPMGFCGSTLDRRDDLRQDAAQLAALAARPDARVLAMPDLKVMLEAQDATRLCWSPMTSVDGAQELILLGMAQGAPRFACAAAKDAPLEGRPVDARAAAMQLGPDEGGILAQARSMIAWHDKHRHCAVCGAATRFAKGGYERICTEDACKASHFPRTDPVAIMLVLDGERCLLGRQPAFPPGWFSALAGFIEPGESLEEAVAREVQEEAGVRVGRVRYVASQAWPFPSSLMIGCFAEALTTRIAVDSTELEEARWFTRQEARAALAGNGPFRCPPPLAIAHHLLKAWAMLDDNNR